MSASKACRAVRVCAVLAAAIGASVASAPAAAGYSGLGPPPADPVRYLLDVARGCLDRHEWDRAIGLADRVLARPGKDPEAPLRAHRVKLLALIGAKRFAEAEAEAQRIRDAVTAMALPSVDYALPPSRWLALGVYLQAEVWITDARDGADAAVALLSGNLDALSAELADDRRMPEGERRRTRAYLEGDVLSAEMGRYALRGDYRRALQLARRLARRLQEPGLFDFPGGARERSRIVGGGAWRSRIAAGSVAQEYLEAWLAADYARMYDLGTARFRRAHSRQEFLHRRHQEVAEGCVPQAVTHLAIGQDITADAATATAWLALSARGGSRTPLATVTIHLKREGGPWMVDDSSCRIVGRGGGR